MKTCLILLIGLLPFLTSAQPAAEPQEANASIDQQYDIQIKDGQLLTAPLKKRVDVKALWGGVGEPASVGATVDNLVKYLRAANTNLNIVLSPGAADVKIGDLKFQSGNMAALIQALSIATDGAIDGRPLGRGAGFGGGPGPFFENNSWALTTTPRKHKASALEAFNLTGYIQTLNLGNNPPPAVTQRKIDEIQDLIRDELRELHPDSPSGSNEPNFRYHAGTHLLIVTGDPEAIEVTRKIVNALSGQQHGGREDLLLDTNPPASQN